MQVEADERKFKELGKFLLTAWENPQVKFYASTQGIDETHIAALKKMLNQLVDEEKL